MNSLFMKILHRSRVGCVALLTLLAVPAMADDNFLPFGTTTFNEIKEGMAGEPFVVSLWSVDCLPCRMELDMLGKLKSENPDFPLVLISTDPIDDREEALYILEEYGLENIESWMFADAFIERLRFSIDPGWYGELPRSYFYNEAHGSVAHSGILTRDKLIEFFPSAAE